MRNFKTKYHLVVLFILLSILTISCEKEYIDIVQTLQYETVNSPTQNTIFSVRFINEKVGFIGCDSSQIFKTTDGGATWRDISIKPFNHPYGYLIGDGPVNKIIAITENLLFASVNGDLLKSIDGGITWFLIAYGEESDIDFYDDKIGYAIVDYGQFNSKLLRTENAGASWQQMGDYYPFGGSSTPRVNKIDCIGRDSLLLIGKERQYLSVNGGNDLFSINLDYNLYLDNNQFSTSYLTSDSFTQKINCVSELLQPKSEFDFQINSIKYFKGKVAAVGEHSVLTPASVDEDSNVVSWHYNFINHGKTISDIYYDLAFTDESHFIAVGKNGVLTRYTYPE